MSDIDSNAWAAELPAGLVTALRGMMAASHAVISKLTTMVANEDDFYSGAAGNLPVVGQDMASACSNALRVVANEPGLSEFGRASLVRKAGAYNTACILFRGALRPRGMYDNYLPLYGASSASETLGGRTPSDYADKNSFAEMRFAPAGPAMVSTAALQGIAALKAMDPVLAPLSLSEIEVHAGQIATGVSL